MKSAKGMFDQYLRNKGIRYSAQREYILDIFLKIEKHLTIPELYGLVRKKYPKIGYATVYRAMKVISETDLAGEVRFGDGIARYEHKYGHEHHIHLICIKCGKFVEVVNPKIEKMQEEIVRDHGFVSLAHKVQIFSVCKKCNGRRPGR